MVSKALKALLVVVLLLVNVLSSQGTGTRVLCIESDGTITVEDSSTGCCGSGEFSFAGTGAGEKVGGLAPPACTSCIDIPLLTTDHPTKTPSESPVVPLPALAAVFAFGPAPEALHASRGAPAQVVVASSALVRTSILRC